MRARPRDLGVVLGTLEPGPRNTIGDVGEVRVGHVTLVSGEGRLVPGKGPVRTGVTVVVPHRGNVYEDRPKAAWDTINGCGELAGALEIREFGVIKTPIGLTNTNGVGSVQSGLVEAALEANAISGIDDDAIIATVSECDDSFLYDIRGMHVRPSHVKDALRVATERFEHGSVGAGTGMCAYDFKAGIGSASRRLGASDGAWTVGALVNLNVWDGDTFTIAGVPVTRELGRTGMIPGGAPPGGSIVIVLATDAPLSSRQLGRIARRGFHGLGRVGSVSYSGSGDISIAFSTAQWVPHDAPKEPMRERKLHESQLNPLFVAAVEATEEAIVDALFTATTVVGRDGNTSLELPIPQTLEILDRYGRLA